MNDINSSTLDRKAARASLLPSVSYNLGHYFSFGKNIDPVTNNFVFESFSGGYTALGLQMSLFSGFSRLNTIKQSRYNLQQVEWAKKRKDDHCLGLRGSGLVLPAVADGCLRAGT